MIKDEKMKLDVLFINPASAKEVYQVLANEYSGIGTPYWALLLAQSCRSKGFQVAILDVLAERLEIREAVERIENFFSAKSLRINLQASGLKFLDKIFTKVSPS